MWKNYTIGEVLSYFLVVWQLVKHIDDKSSVSLRLSVLIIDIITIDMPLPTAVLTLVTSLASATAVPEVETLPAPAAARHTIPPPGPSSDPAEDDTLLHLSEHICYSVVVPTICACGVLGNTLNLLVLTRGRREMKQSIYVYLLSEYVRMHICSYVHWTRG